VSLIAWKNFVKEIKTVIKDEVFRRGVDRATFSYEKGIYELLNRYPKSRTYAEEVRKIKEEAIENIENLIEECVKNFKAKGVKVYLASDAEEARRIIGEIVGSGKIIVKGKSMVSEEIDLREYLEKMGNEVWETDLGEFLVQLGHDRPMHIVTPSIHYPREKVAKILEELFGREFDPNNVEAMVRAVSDFLRKKYFEADVGILGANAVAAKDAAIVLIHNEGNLRFIENLPMKLIILTEITKIVPTLEDAIKVTYVTSRFAKYKVAGYYEVLAGLKSPGRIGPKEVYLILLDNGRRKMINDPDFREASYCLKCGACMYMCPVFQIVAGKFSGKTYMAGIGAILTYFMVGEETAAPAIYTCLLDGRCREICPMQIDVPEMIRKLRVRLSRSAIK